MKKVTIAGGAYTLLLQGAVESHSWMGGTSESGDKYCSATYWKGSGRLKTQTDELVFEFKTRAHREDGTSVLDLQKEFIQFSGISTRATIVSKEKVYELFFKELEARIREEERKGNLFVACITPPIIDAKPLINQGFIIEPGYQMELVELVPSNEIS